MSERGRLIVFEGIDGAGKSTQIAALAEWLTAQQVTVVTTREPGGTPIGEAIRSLVLHHEMDPETELLLLCAARREHIVKVIEPALAAGRWVISDRFADASYAYQVGGRGVAKERFTVVDEWTRAGLQPDLVFLFDLPVEVAARRRTARDEGGNADRFEREAAAFFCRVQSAYRERAAHDPARFVQIDAQLPIAAQRDRVVREVAARWFARGGERP